MLKALCESRSTGSRVISEARYLGQEGEMGLLEGENLGPGLLSDSLKCLDKVSQYSSYYSVCFMLHSF